jgi:hypothetical protein
MGKEKISLSPDSTNWTIIYDGTGELGKDPIERLLIEHVIIVRHIHILYHDSGCAGKIFHNLLNLMLIVV